MTARLATRGLECGYGKVPVVHGLDLEVRAGEVFVLLGPNGAGKTTTILTLAGALRPLGGTITWDGHPIAGSQHRRARRGLALVPEERSVVAGLTVMQNLRLARGDVDLALALFPELETLSRRRACLLSGGEQQMLSLARAISRRPVALLADELSLGLAPKVVRRLLTAVRHVADDGAAVLLVEQHAHEALAIADRACVLHRGKIAVEGSAETVRTSLDDLERVYLSGSTPTESAIHATRPADRGPRTQSAPDGSASERAR
jgi:ABC-type branched-subunit amino acid transport system ATPase component